MTETTATAEVSEKTLKVPLATHTTLNKLCRALEIIDFAEERAYKRVSIGDALDRLLEQEWAQEILKRARGPPKAKL